MFKKIRNADQRDSRVHALVCSRGHVRYERRKEMFYAQRENILKKMDELQKTLDMVEFKCWYYDVACQDNSEALMEQHMKNDMPEEIKACYENAHRD